MPPVEFEPTVSAMKRPQTYALDREATGTGLISLITLIIININGFNFLFMFYLWLINVKKSVKVI